MWQVIAQSHNNYSEGGVGGHAEMLALQRASTIQSRLDDCTLVVTLEPCMMCFGACINYRIKRVVFGAYSPKYGFSKLIHAADTHASVSGVTGFYEGIQFSRFTPYPHAIDIAGGVMAREAGALMKQFFAAKRGR